MKQVFKIQVMGALQGVGFRLFVYRLATRLKLTGFVQNCGGIVNIEVLGTEKSLVKFLMGLQFKKPKAARIYNLSYSAHEAKDYAEFRILHSEHQSKKLLNTLPDIAICEDCLKEIFDPRNKRHNYPFTSCMHCGPRYSIMTTTPFERANTAMSGFQKCPACQAEYNNVSDRRFHDELNSCPECGPTIELLNRQGEKIAGSADAISQAAVAIANGRIVAIKDAGGFRLYADARNDLVVDELRRRKNGFEGPFTMIYPSFKLIEKHFSIHDLEKRLLLSAAAPVVILEKNGRINNAVAEGALKGMPGVQIKLPHTALQHLLMHALNFPVVVSEGNIADEVTCCEKQEALERLQNIADLFLVHNLPIIRPMQDSTTRIMAEREQVVERARGYSSISICLTKSAPSILAAGSHSRTMIGIRHGKEMILSDCVGKQDKDLSYPAFSQLVKDIEHFYKFEPSQIVCDLDPKYLSRKYLSDLGSNVLPVQHQYAHVLACMADNELEGQVLGISWDGTGPSMQGGRGGSDFLLTTTNGAKHLGNIRGYLLPGEMVGRQPRQSALGILFTIFGEAVFEKKHILPVQTFSGEELKELKDIFRKNNPANISTGVGRLFDAVASIIGLRQQAFFEGQAAAELESLITNGIKEAYPFEIEYQEYFVVNWQPIIEAILQDMEDHVSIGKISAKFHNTLAEVIVQIAGKTGEERVVLSGSCFQNKYLTERAIARLREEGFQPYWHQRIPGNDSGIAAGQLLSIFHTELLKIFEEDGKRSGKVCIDGVLKTISLEQLPYVKEGDQVLITDGKPVAEPLNIRSMAEPKWLAKKAIV